MGLAKRIATARIWNPDLAGRDRDTVALRRMWQVLNPRAVPPDVPLDVERINELLEEAARAAEVNDERTETHARL